MVTHRIERLNDQLKVTIADILLRSVKDPQIGFVTVTRVEVSRDLRSARVYISVMGGEKDKKATFEAVKKATPFIQYQTGSTLKLRCTPRLEFFLDPNIEYSIRINRLIDELSNDPQE
jgi:ribosome-binding factor A